VSTGYQHCPQLLQLQHQETGSVEQDR
jgi:hypothetical protein